MYFNAAQFLPFAQAHPNIREEVLVLTGERTQQNRYNEFGTYISPPEVTLEQVEQYLKLKLDAIADRDESSTAGEGTFKWFRPWDVVPELRNWAAPYGDFGVGVEVEMGFNTHDAARQVARHVRDWEYITLDYEGGDIPIEATFPPVLYSEFASSDAVRYLDYLKENASLVYEHLPHAMVGTHINVSAGGRTLPHDRISRLSTVLDNTFDQLSVTQKRRYFGRRPYDTCFGQGFDYATRTYKWVEFKLFNSQLDSKRLQQYADIAVSLVKLALNEAVDITQETVHIALEEGYSILGDLTDSANVSNDAEPIALAIAA